MIGDRDGTDIGATDLFFSLAAILIILLSVSSQSLRSVVRDKGADTKGLAALAQTESIWLVLAQADGLILHQPGQQPSAVGLDEILTGRTESWASQAQAPIWVVIEEDAADSAFLLDTSLARAAVQEVRRVRLPAPCANPRLLSEGLLCDG